MEITLLLLTLWLTAALFVEVIFLGITATKKVLLTAVGLTAVLRLCSKLALDRHTFRHPRGSLSTKREHDICHMI